MRNVFVSRPVEIDPKFDPGYASFRRFLESHQLTPKTLGVNAYATNSPLDEVIAIMNECVGAVILGYPHIRVEKGTLKGEAIDSSKPLVLGTEWNHIEAALAHVKGLPLLVIHHKGIRGGVFDRGAWNKFLYEVDLSGDAWVMIEKITGAITTWQDRLLAAPLGQGSDSAHAGDLTFDERSGTYQSGKSAFRYCPKCLHSPRKDEVPLKEEPHGWTCGACGTFYRNPDWNPPPDPPRDFDLLRRRRR
jgi:hypothetical protein